METTTEPIHHLDTPIEPTDYLESLGVLLPQDRAFIATLFEKCPNESTLILEARTTNPHPETVKVSSAHDAFQQILSVALAGKINQAKFLVGQLLAQYSKATPALSEESLRSTTSIPSTGRRVAGGWKKFT